MSQENVEIVRREMEHFMRTEEPLWEVIDANIEIREKDLPEGGVYRGHAGWNEWVAQFDNAWKDVAVEPEEYIDAGGDKVVLVLRVTAQGRNGISLQRRDGVVNTLRDGKIVRIDYYGSRHEALEAAGRTE